MSERALPASIVEALGRLKETPRTGWLDRGIPACATESVADHSFGVALLTWLLAPDELDRARAIELALIHDLAEAVVGDLTPYDRSELQHLDPAARVEMLNRRQIRSAERSAAKYAAEDAAMEEMSVSLPLDRRLQLLDLWAELRERMSPEAQFVKEMDILESWLQSRRYRDRYPDAPMESFEQEARELLGAYLS